MTEDQQTSESEAERPPVVAVVASFALLVLLQLAGGAIVAAIAGGTSVLSGQTEQTAAELQRLVATPWFLAGSVAINASLCLLIAAGGAKLGGERFSIRVRLGDGPGVAAAAVASVGLIGLSQAFSSVHALVDLDVATSLDLMTEVVASSSGASFAALLLSAGLFAGIGEELFFRGFVQTRLRQRWGAWPAICVTAAAFGLLHYDPVHSLIAFGMGIYLGWLVERTDSIRPAILAHVLNNTVWILTAGQFTEPTQLSAGVAVLVGSVLVVAIATAGFAALTRPA